MLHVNPTFVSDTLNKIIRLNSCDEGSFNNKVHCIYMIYETIIIRKSWLLIFAVVVELGVLQHTKYQLMQLIQ